LLYFCAGFAMGGLFLAAAGMGWSWPPALLLPTYYHVLLVGWVAQLIFGVSLWMFPILSKERPRGSQALGWTTYICLNAGLLLRVVAEPLLPVLPGLGWLLVASGILQWAAGLTYVINIWARVRPRGG
jgi:hypothetical protein